MARLRLELPPMRPTREWKQRACAFIAALREDDGPVSIDVKPRRDTPSSQARGYYFGVVVASFADFLRNTGMRLPAIFESFEDMAHKSIKERCLRLPVVDADGQPVVTPQGEVLHVTGSFADLDAEGVSRLIEDARTYLDDEYEIFVPEPDVFHGASVAGGRGHR